MNVADRLPPSVLRNLVDTWSAGVPLRWVKLPRLVKRGLARLDGSVTAAGVAAIFAAGAAIAPGPVMDVTLARLGYRKAWGPTGWDTAVMELSESGRITYTRIRTTGGPVVVPFATVDFVWAFTACCCAARVGVAC